MALEESLKEKAERLMRMANAIEESNSRRSSQESRRSLYDENALFVIDDEGNDSTREGKESMDLDELLKLNDELEDEESSKGTHNSKTEHRLSDKENFSFAPVDLAPDESTLGTNKTLESAVITPSRIENKRTEANKSMERRSRSLNLIFSKAISLDSEEVEESKSFWSIQKSARNFPKEILRVVSPSPENQDNKAALSSESKADLLEKSRGFQSALVSMRENARLRYEKLEMEHLRLQENYSASKAQLESLENQLNDARKTKEILEGQLDAVYGKDVAGLIKHMNENQTRLERELHRVKLERDQIVLEDKELRMKIGNCSTCQKHIKNDGASKDVGRRSWWKEAVQATSQIFELDKEAEATAQLSVSNHPDVSSAQEEPLDKPSSLTRPNPLDEDIESLKKRMDDELESLRDEWSSASSNHGRLSKSKKEKHGDNASSSSKKKKRKGGRKSLEEFFSSAAVSLNEEELDETQSFWSRSVRSMSGVDVESKEEKKSKSLSGSNTAVKRPSWRRTKITTDDNWEHFSSNASSKEKLAASPGRSRLRKMLALPSQAIFDRARAMGDGLPCLSDQADEQRNFLQRSAQAFISTERNPAHRSAMPPKEFEVLELPPVELIGSRWTTTPENQEDPLGFIGKEVTAWRAGATSAVNS